MPAVISGKLRGLQLAAPHGHRTHVMSTKVRGAIFNALGELGGLTVLDPYAGSGALGFEALSNGAESVLFIDNDKEAQRAIGTNIKKLELEGKAKLVRANCSSWSDHNPDEKFDLILLDPPYDGIKESQLAKMADHVKAAGTVVISLPPSSGFKLLSPDFRLLSSKNYGDATLSFYRKSL